MSRNRLYKIGIVALVIINLLQVGALVINQNQKRRVHPRLGHGFRDRAITIMNLNNKQTEQFQQLAHAHRTQILKLNNKEQEYLITYFGSPTESILDSINLIQKQKIEVTQRHFKEIKEILKPKQYPDFMVFKEEALKIILR